MSLLKLSFKKCHENAVIPVAKGNGDIGMDIHSVEDVVVPEGRTVLISTGLQLGNVYVGNLDTGLSALLKIESRSGMASKGLFCVGGIIDLGYTGEIRVCLVNSSNAPYVISKGDRIAQFVAYSVFSNTQDVSKQCVSNPNGCSIIIEETDEIKERSNRGEAGFGASGK